jgi:hypothetical protein
MPKISVTRENVHQIVNAHDTYWDDRKEQLYKYKRAYETRFWSDEASDRSQITIETADAFGFIESFVNSLFTRNPGIIAKKGLRAGGDPKKAAALANNFLLSQREVIEDAARLALIYPNSFLKLSPRESSDPLRRISSVAVPPWEIILDRQARRWDEQKYVGHSYYCSLADAREKFGNKQFQSLELQEYFDDKERKHEQERPDGDDLFKYIRLVEIYDLLNGKLYFWSPQWKGGEAWLEEGPIPFFSANGEPIVNIIPLYFNRIPDKPLDGYSAMSRVYDQVFETNVIRSYQANAVRKASRQYLVKKGALDEEQMSQITSGIDGLFIEVDNDSLGGIIAPVPQNPMPGEMQAYYAMVQADKDKGSMFAPFTRGESTRASATEIVALAAYTSSEVGRMARERDKAIEGIARIYLGMIALYLQDEGEAEGVVIDGELMFISAKDLADDFVIYALDQASTPISESVRKREFLQSVPLLQSLGVPNSDLLAEIVRALNLPENLLQSVKPGGQPGVVGAAEGQGIQVAPDAREAASPAALAGTAQGAGANLGSFIPRS